MTEGEAPGGAVADAREAMMSDVLKRLLNVLAIAAVLIPVGVSATEKPADDNPPLQDKFLGHVSMSGVTDAFHDRVDAFSGYMHINMVDVKLPGKGGLDLVVQQYYSSNVWSRVDYQSIPNHVPGADPYDNLGGAGWQLHMGKLIKPSSSGPWTAVMPDGSTHLLYDDISGSGQISRERWKLEYDSSAHLYNLTLTDGTIYRFATSSVYPDYWNNLVYQCTEISKPGVSASIQIQYDSSLTGWPLLDTITDTWGRTVHFQYVTSDPPPPHFDTPRISTMTVMNGADTLQTWTFNYQLQTSVAVTPPPAETDRDIYALTSITPPAGDDWGFAYWADYEEDIAHGKFCLHRVTMPTGGAISYWYEAKGFDTGQALSQSDPVQFSVVKTRLVQDRDASILAEWSYDYSPTGILPGSDGAKTKVTVKNISLDTIMTDTSEFNGWTPYSGLQCELGSCLDPNMWKVGLIKQRTVKTYDADQNPPVLKQTESESYTYSRGDQIYDWYDYTTNWSGPGNGRFQQGEFAYYTASEPFTVTQTVGREGAVGYTTTKSNFDAYGNPKTITEKVDNTTKRTTQLTYWTNQVRNILVGKVKTRSVSPGAQECIAYDDDDGGDDGGYGWVIKKVLSPASLSPCTGDHASHSLETDYAYDGTTGDLTSETKVADTVGDNSVKEYLSYANGEPEQIQVANTNVLFDRTINPSGTVKDSTDGRGESDNYRTRYTYDDLNRLTKIEPPIATSKATSLTYAGDWSTVTVTRGNHSIVYSFDGLGRLTKRHDLQTDHRVNYTYNALGVKTKQELVYPTMTGGTITVDTKDYDVLGRLVKVTHEGDSSTVTYSYSAVSGAGPTVTVKDEDNYTTTMAYEGFGDPDDTRLISVTNAQQKQTTYDYNGYNLVSSIEAALDQGNRSFTYYSNLLLHAETNPEGGTTSYTYDDLGNLIEQENADQTWEDFGYDGAGRMTRHSFSDSTPTVTFTYDGASDRTQMSSVDGTFDYAYDYDKNLTSKTSTAAIGSATETLAYDTMDRLQTITYPSGRKVKYTYDDRDWVTDVTSPAGGSNYATNIARYTTGVIQQMSLGNLATTSYGLDSRYRVNSISVTKGAGTFLNLGFIYDPAGDLTDWNDHFNSSNNRTFAYDDLHRLTNANAPNLWGDISFQYDDLGNRIGRTQSGKGTATYTYDDTTNRLTKVTTASLAEQYHYDDRGNLIEADVAQPTITSVTPVQVRPGGGGTPVFVTITGSGFQSSSQATFNGVVKPTSYLSPSTLRMTLTYDDITSANIYPVTVINSDKPGAEVPVPAGPSAPMVVYFADVPPSYPQYNDINLIRYNSITAGCSSSNYCPGNTLLRSQMAVFLLKAEHGPGYTPPPCTGIFGDVPCPGGFAVDWIEEFYNEGITAGCSADPLLYCPNDNITRSQMAVFLLATKEGPDYTPPDCTGMFADVPCPSGFAVKWIEEVARREIYTGCGGGNFCPWSAVNRALMAQMVARTWGYTMPYTHTYTFNVANQLTSVTKPSGTASFTYDGDGLRFSKTTDAGTTYYLRDPQGRVLVEFKPTVINEYVYLDGQRLCKIQTDQNQVQSRLYYHADTVGTPLAETDDLGQLVAGAQYYPFGSEVSPGAATDPHKFTGKELDDETGLYYFNARYYDADLGRFVSVDPVGGSNTDPQSWNRYAYALNNPVTVTDPSGRCAGLCVGAAVLGGAALVAFTNHVLNSPNLVHPNKTNAQVWGEDLTSAAHFAGATISVTTAMARNVIHGNAGHQHRGPKGGKMDPRVQKDNLPKLRPANEPPPPPPTPPIKPPPGGNLLLKFAKAAVAAGTAGSETDSGSGASSAKPRVEVVPLHLYQPPKVHSN